jgi:trans-aconitate 2-methyltransferase
MADRWPDAQIVGVDSSRNMLDQATAHDTTGRVTWVEQDVSHWDPTPAAAELIVTNATLQWVPGHERMIPGWLDSLPDGGAFAMQVPGNFTADSHRLIRDVVQSHPRADTLAPLLRHDPVLPPEGYADLLSRGCGHVDAWETTYVQILDQDGAQANPVLEWVKGTALRPILDRLEPHEVEPFLADLGARLADAYPRRPYGVPFPFRRIFAVGVKVEMKGGTR